MKNIHQYKNTDLVNKVFDNAYKKYDLMNDVMSMGTHRIWKQQFVNSIELENNDTIVDMASGTGDISRLLLKKTQNKKIQKKKIDKKIKKKVGLNPWSTMADLMKYELIYHHGGFYFDTNIELLKDITHLTNKRFVVCNEDNNIDKYMSCGCGRSPTGECIGWHGLTEEEYQKKLKEYKARSKS